MSISELTEVEISVASTTATPRRLALGIASVITAEDIKNSGATEIAHVLEMVLGLHVSRSSARLQALYSIKGVHAALNPHVLVLINGTQILDPFNSALPPTFRLPVANISRIEVIRGPSSALYGADAVAGVINIITKSSTELGGGHAGARVGSFGHRDVWTQYGGTTKDWDVAFSFEYASSDRDRTVSADQQTFFDGLFGTNASLAGALDTRFNILNTHVEVERGNWQVSIWDWRQRDGGSGPGVGQAIDPSCH